MPSRKDSNDREMLESWEGFGSRFNDMARCRSSKESLIWSARRSNCEGLDIVRGEPRGEHHGRKVAWDKIKGERVRLAERCEVVGQL